MHMSGRALPSGAMDPDAPPLVLVESLHPHSSAHAHCELLFAQQGVAPLRAYLDSEGGEESFGRYAEAAADELTTLFRAHGKGREQGTYIAAFGQSVFLNAVAHAVAAAAGAPTEILDKVLEIELGEAEGILVPLFGGPVVQLSLIHI